jgi:osmotically-inducible protein OsmY
MSNQRVIDEIRVALERDSRINQAAQVAVSERAGLVTLRGTVRSFHQRRVAAEIADSVPGVSAVADQLLVDPRDHARDNQVRGAALQALMSDEDVPADRIEITVADGWLTLTGEVKRQRESTAAFDAVSKVAGVGGITNKITVVTAGMDG